MNNYDFWEDYLKRVKEAIIDLCKKKDTLKIDLHLHSNHSADGKQSIKEILESTSQKGFDIIAITDHDTLKAYDELFRRVKRKLTNPIVIPGIEFTVDNREYGNQCHLVQLFVNPRDEVIRNDVKKAKTSSFNRSKIQFKRIRENLTLQELFDNNDITVSYMEYKRYLTFKHLVPEYDTLCSYLMEKLQDKGITTFDVLKTLEIKNELDPYEDRRELKRKRYEVLKGKYEVNEDNKHSVRFLLSLLAVREVDDDWWKKPSCGSLSVNSYGQPTVESLNTKYKTIFAHPTEKSLDVVDKLISENNNIVGLELNIRNNYEKISRFNKLLTKYNLIKTIGSDSHDSTLKFYEDMSFYEIKKKDMLSIVERLMDGKD